MIAILRNDLKEIDELISRGAEIDLEALHTVFVPNSQKGFDVDLNTLEFLLDHTKLDLNDKGIFYNETLLEKAYRSENQDAGLIIKSKILGQTLEAMMDSSE